MSLTKKQFQVLVEKVIQKITAETEGATSYIEYHPGCFEIEKDTDRLYYQVSTKLLVDLDELAHDGGMIPSNDYHTFIDQLLVDTQKLIKAVNLQRQPFLEYLEKIENL